MVRQQHQIAWAMMGVVFCGLGAGHCWAQLLLTQSQKPAATQPAPSSVMSAPNLRQQKTAAWRKVCAADKTEIAQIKAAVKADMKAGDADAVVAAEGQLKVVQGRLTQEKMESPFPPYFQPTNFTMGLSPDLLEFESTRNKAVAAALAQWHQVQAALKNRQIQKDRQKITQLKVLVKTAMKAGHASAVVSAVAQLKQARLQLQQDMANTYLKHFTVEAYIDGETTLHITSRGIYWQSGFVQKPGFYRGRRQTYVNGRAWFPRWRHPDQARGPDRSNVLPLHLAPSLGYKMRVLDIAPSRNERGLAPRDPVTLTRRRREETVYIPDTQPGEEWYTILLYLPRQ